MFYWIETKSVFLNILLLSTAVLIYQEYIIGEYSFMLFNEPGKVTATLDLSRDVKWWQVRAWKSACYKISIDTD